MTASATPQQAETAKFEIQRIFLKDLSFEAPNTPHTFSDEWKPEVALNLETKSSRLQDHIHEVVLSITATVTTSNKTAFLVEVQQAGIFHLTGFRNEELHHILGSACPNILFPYAREVITNTVMRGGFPQLLLAPVNFDALYAQHLAKASQAQAGSETKN